MDFPWRELLIILALTLLIIGVSAKRSGERLVSTRNVGITLFALYMVMVFSITGVTPMSGFHTEIRMSEISLVPFQGMKELIELNRLFAAVNIGGNMLMFLPFGLFLPLLWSNYRRWWKTVLSGAALSLFIELVQLFNCRGTDIDDLIMNTLGTVLGYLAFLLVRKIAGKRKGIQSISGRLMPALCVLLPFLAIMAVGFYDRCVVFGILS